jgi:alanine-glyoxylate transaminase / serine-glyoxylate transaminase / serine-pyruvate transaminase
MATSTDERPSGELRTPRRILLGPGPSEINPRVLRAMMSPMLGYFDPAFLAIADETVTLLREVFGTGNRLTLPVSGTGTAGMEAALANIVEPGDRVLVGTNGYFGLRIAEIVARCGGTVVPLAAPWGRAIAPEQVEAELARARTELVAVVHAETSTGVLQPLGDIARLAHEHEALLLADCVTSLGGQPVDMDEHGVDIAYSGTQKCLGGPPGLAPLSVSARAEQALRRRRTGVRSFYLDLDLLGRYWLDEPREYHHTVSMTLVYALREALRVVLEEGLPARYARHERNAHALAAGLQALGLELAAEEGRRAPMLTTVRIPNGVDDAGIRTRLLHEYAIEIGGGLGELTGQVWRIGLMGESSTQQNVLLVLSALERLLRAAGCRFEPGAGVAAASAVYAER